VLIPATPALVRSTTPDALPVDVVDDTSMADQEGVEHRTDLVDAALRIDARPVDQRALGIAAHAPAFRVVVRVGRVPAVYVSACLAVGMEQIRLVNAGHFLAELVLPDSIDELQPAAVSRTAPGEFELDMIPDLEES